MALPLAPVLVALAPQLAGWLFGKKAGEAVDKVSGFVRDIFGPEAAGSADALERAIASDPDKALVLKNRLIAAESEERQRQHEEMLALLADTQSARSQTVELARAGSTIAWGAPVMSTIVLLAFAVLLGIVIFKAVPIPAENRDLMIVMLTALTAMATQAVNFWLGSSRSSEIKNATIDKLMGR